MFNIFHIIEVSKAVRPQWQEQKLANCNGIAFHLLNSFRKTKRDILKC